MSEEQTNEAGGDDCKDIVVILRLNWEIEYIQGRRFAILALDCLTITTVW